MPDTRKVLVVTDTRTIVKKVKFGTPIRNVTQGGTNLSSLGGIDLSGQQAGGLLVYQPSTDTYYAAQLTGGTNLEVSYDSASRELLTINTTLENLASDIIPDSDETRSLGSPTKKFNELYLAGSTITLGTIKLKDSDGQFTVKDSSDNTIFRQLSLSTDNASILSYDSDKGVLSFRDSDVARTDIDETFHKNLTVASGLTADSATLGGISLSGNDLTTTGKLYYANVFSNIGDLPNASTYHGMFAHVHSTGAAYFAHAGEWHKLVDSDTQTEQQVYKLKSNDADIQTLNFTTLGTQATSAVRNTLSGGTGLTYAAGSGEFSITNTGVTAATYGSSTQIPVISINAQGQIDSATTRTVSGVSGVDYDSATGTFTVQTSTGNFSDVITLDAAPHFTTQIRSKLQAGTGVTFDSASGTISIGQAVGTGDSVTFNGVYISGDLTVSGTTTTVNSETINLADNILLINSNFLSGSPTENSGLEISRGSSTNKTFLWNETDDKWTIGSETFVAGTVEADLTGDVTGQVSDLGNHTTTALAEGSNLYYTSARADSDAKNAIEVTDAGGDGSMIYDASSGTITYTGPSASEVRAHFTADKGLTVTNGEFNIDSANVRGMFVGGTGITYTSGTGTFDLTNTGVTAGAYGSGSLVPVVTVNAQGQIDSIGTVAVAGVSSTAWDSATGQFTINTADGGTYKTTIKGFGDNQTLGFGNANDFTITHNGSHTVLKDGGTGNLFIEGSRIHLASQNNGNPIYLTAGSNDGVKLFDSTGDLRLATNSTGIRVTGNLKFDTLSNTTTDITEGNNLYYTTARADSDAKNAVSAGGDLSYNPATGVFSITVADASISDSGVRSKLSVSGDLAYDSATGQFSFTERTDQEVRNIFSSSGILSYDSATGQFSLTNSTVRNLFSSSGDLNYDSATGQFSIDVETVYTKANFDSDLGDASTTDLPEGTNLYYTTARADSDAKNAISVTDAGGDGSLSYSASTGVITYTGPSASEVRAHFTADKGLTVTNGEFNIDSANVKGMFQAGTGVTFDSANGQISIGQSVGTTDDVTFGKVTMDSGIADHIDLTPQSPNPNKVRGRIFYDSDAEAVSYYNETSDVTINVGQEFVFRVKNNTGAQIDNGNLVYITGADTSSKLPTIAKAQANSVLTYKAIGMATHDIVDGAFGYVTETGFVNDVNTGGLTPGASLYLSPDSAGKFTATEPSGDDFPYSIGWVVTADSSTGRVLISNSTETFDNVRATHNIVADRQIKADSADFNLLRLDGSQYTNTNKPAGLTAGDVYFNSSPDALVYKNTDVEVKLGQDDIVRVYNNSGADIATGQAVYVTGATNDFPTIALAKANSFNTVYNTLGLVTKAITNGSYGYVTTRGLFGGLDTSAFTAGSQVHVSADSAGKLVTANPTFPNYAFEVGTVLVSDSAGGGAVGGCVQVRLRPEVFETQRTQGAARFDGNVTVAGNLNILGTETKTQVATLAVGDQFISVQEGDTITTSQSTGSGLNDVTFKDHYQGDSNLTYFVQIYDAYGGGDTIKWGFDSANGGPGISSFTFEKFDSDNGPLTWNLDSDGKENIPLRFNITLDVAASTGHDSGDVWKGSAEPANQDFGFFGNYNSTTQPFTHAGMFYDASEGNFKFFDRYDSNISGTIKTDAGTHNFALGDVEAAKFTATTFMGALSGNASTATLLETERKIAIGGDITAAGVNFNGGSNITLTASVDSGVISNVNIASNAAIADTKLANISTAGKVLNSATTATAANTGSTIVARDASGNFTAGTVTLTDLHVGNLHVDSADIIQLISDNETYSTANQLMTAIQTLDSDNSGLNADTLDGQEGTYYRLNVYNASGTLLN